MRCREHAAVAAREVAGPIGFDILRFRRAPQPSPRTTLSVDCEGGCSGVKHSVVSVKLKHECSRGAISAKSTTSETRTLEREIRLLLHAEPKTPPPAASIGPTAGWSVLPGSFGNGWPWIAGVCRRASSPTHGLTIFPIACMSAPSTIRRQGSPTLWGSRCQQAFGP